MAFLKEGVIPIPDGEGPNQGCPRCDGDATPNDGVRGGTCDAGGRAGFACDAHGASPYVDFGRTSFDCPSDPTLPTVVLRLGSVPFATTPASVTLGAGSPRCTSPDVPSGTPCFCGTCNSAFGEACAGNADCPPSGGSPGVCNGRRCLGGVNDGAPCTAVSACPGGGFCARLGEPTRPHTCLDDSTTPAIEGCAASGADDAGVCAFGPVDGYCSNHPNRGCLDDGDCDDVPGACAFATRQCWADNGVIGASLAVAAATTTPVGGIADPVELGTLACMRPTSDAFTDIVWGLPGIVRLRQPGRLVFTSVPAPTVTPAAPTPTPTPTVTPPCPPVPAVCATPIAAEKASLQLADRAPDDKDRLVWRWTKGAATDLASLGDPRATDDYALCLYDAAGVRATMRIPAGGLCRGRPCWQARSNGFVYRNKDALTDGIAQLTLRAGAAGKAQHLAKGQGDALPMPALAGLTPPLQVQLRNLGTGACWGAAYGTPFDRLTPTLLKDRAD
jgi:hypothetical protein